MEGKSIFEQDDKFADLVKIARNRSVKRSIIISMLVTIGTIIILWGLLYVGQHFMYERMYKDADTTNDYYRMYGANVYPNGTTYDYFFVAGSSTVTAHKEVNGHLIGWDSRSNFYTILGTKALFQNNSYIAVNESTYKNDHEMVKFHLPNEEAINNDLSYLEKLPGYYSVEVALSFDREIPLKEVEETFPTSSWLWLLEDELYEDAVVSKVSLKDFKDSLNFTPDFSEVDGDRVLGFSVEQNISFKESATQFITFLQHKSEDSLKAEEVLQTLKQFDDDEIPIAGVVLTGTVDEILPYTKKEAVRVVRTGIIIPY